MFLNRFLSIISVDDSSKTSLGATLIYDIVVLENSLFNLNGWRSKFWNWPEYLVLDRRKITNIFPTLIVIILRLIRVKIPFLHCSACFTSITKVKFITKIMIITMWSEEKFDIHLSCDDFIFSLAGMTFWCRWILRYVTWVKT